MTMAVNNNAINLSTLATHLLEGMRSEKSNARISPVVKQLLTNEKGWFGSIIEYIRAFFGSVTPGSVTDLRRSVHLLSKAILQLRPAEKQLDSLTDAFAASFARRVKFLQVDVQDSSECAAAVLYQALKSKRAAKATINTQVGAILQDRATVGVVPQPVMGEVVPVSQEPPAKQPAAKAWSRWSVAVVSVASLSGGALLGCAYWAGYDVSALWQQVPDMPSMPGKEHARAVADYVSSFWASAPSEFNPVNPVNAT